MTFQMFSLSVPISCSFISIVHHDPDWRGFQSQNGPKVGCTTSLPSGKPTYLWKIHENPNVYNKYKSAFNGKVGYSDVFVPFCNINSPNPSVPQETSDFRVADVRPSVPASSLESQRRPWDPRTRLRETKRLSASAP